MAAMEAELTAAAAAKSAGVGSLDRGDYSQAMEHFGRALKHCRSSAGAGWPQLEECVVGCAAVADSRTVSSGSSVPTLRSAHPRLAPLRSNYSPLRSPTGEL